MITWLLIAGATLVGVYLVLTGALVVAGRGGRAAAVVRFVPDCAVLFARLLRDPVVPRRHRLLLAGTLLYLASPIDLVPDFIPIAGQLDDAIVVGLVLRAVVRGTGDDLLRRHWPGSEQSLGVLLRLAGRAAG
jgi:uncharacterized membrane protein YkvA (DUF1232 family)